MYCFLTPYIDGRISQSKKKELTLKPLCSTRWESRINSVKAVKYQLPESYDELMELTRSSNADTGIIHKALCLANYTTEFKLWYEY